MGPVVITVGTVRFRDRLEILGHARQMHPDATGLTALTLQQKASLHGAQAPQTSSLTNLRRLRVNGQQAVQSERPGPKRILKITPVLPGFHGGTLSTYAQAEG